MPAFPKPSITMSQRDVTKALLFVPTLPTGPNTYGPTISFDMSQPEDHFTIEIEYITDYDIQGYLDTLAIVGSTLSVTEDYGKVWTGKVLSTSQRKNKGTKVSTYSINMKSVNLDDNKQFSSVVQ